MADTVSGDSPDGLQRLENLSLLTFTQPKKMIHESQDVQQFLVSKAYTDIVTFLFHLNNSMFPRRNQSSILVYTLDHPNRFPTSIDKLRELLSQLEQILVEAPPDLGPRRFGNISFRHWHSLVQQRIDKLLEHLIEGSSVKENARNALVEIKEYLLGSWGSPQRLDYGTGHELSFLAFLGCLWKLNYFPESEEQGAVERDVVIGVVEPYLQLVRKIIKTYNLEPAGSRGVWGLDDHSFVPYIFGSAQLARPIQSDGVIPMEGSLPDAPPPRAITNPDEVGRYRTTNFYFQAIGFIVDVKRGPFWEHSPTLWDISGVEAGWAKINKGMIKMYIAEVLSKFPVVQHFPFGSFFRWERDPKAGPIHTSAQSASPSLQRGSQGLRNGVNMVKSVPTASTARVPRIPGNVNSSNLPNTRAPWVGSTGQAFTTSTATVSERLATIPGSALEGQTTKAPWASK